MNDLIASEGKYHLLCYNKFKRKVDREELSKSGQNADIAMVWLVDELHASAKAGHIVELREVFQRYCILTEECGKTLPPSFVSRLTTFRDKLCPYIEKNI